ncbi:hypothetical protein JRQ81_015232 [Phrynocephalus forsythii]|uniref:Uncharacterized protein n=1 Tax=Phrynocephalus forsythii TaxID=171643 RepID=A0A9Q1B1T2_9SAUR|nr:hypothetical protein JRQ81_015232 [Phrynocephalus forsythii]
MAQKRGRSGSAVSRELLSVGNGGGIHETLLLNSKHAKKKDTGLQTTKLPRSKLLDRVQNFLPQMASANDQLRKEMDNTPLQEFDIEHIDPSIENIIEMNVALVELSGSDREEDDSPSEDDSESEDCSVSEEVTVNNIKLPTSKREGRIEVLNSKTNE